MSQPGDYETYTGKIYNLTPRYIYVSVGRHVRAYPAIETRTIPTYPIGTMVRVEWDKELQQHCIYPILDKALLDDIDDDPDYDPYEY
ncbi:Uncharacterised protein [Chlamydia trachomatis]|nr:Uncharacterised protein [Chlamydia trachomatis]